MPKSQMANKLQMASSQNVEVSTCQTDKVPRCQNVKMPQSEHIQIPKCQTDKISKWQSAKTSTVKKCKTSNYGNDKKTKYQNHKTPKRPKCQHRRVTKYQNVKISKWPNIKLTKCQNVVTSKCPKDKMSDYKNVKCNCVWFFWIDCQVNVYPTRGSLVGRAGRARVANFNSRSGNTRVARGPSAEYILLLLSRGSVSDPRPIQKKHRVRSLSVERGFTKVAATEKLSGRESGNSGLSPPE